VKKALIAGVLLVLAVVGIVVLRWDRGKPPVAGADPGDAGVTIFARDGWLDSCVGPCRRKVRMQLAHLSGDKQRQFCDVNCECGMEKMTEPGPKAGQVKAPSAAWMRLNDDQQMQAAQDCQTRSIDSVTLGGFQTSHDGAVRAEPGRPHAIDAVGGIQPPGAPSP
jgi:hypothetical protein